MLSFTSSSSRAGIIASLAAFLAVSAAYALLVPMVIRPGGDGTTEWQKNLIKAQRYAFSDAPSRCVLVGSSMSFRLSEKYFARPADVYNLAFTGGSSLTGLKLVAAKRDVPSVLLVEANDTLIRGADPKLMANLFEPVGSELRRRVPALREEYIPAVLVHKLFRDAFHRGGEQSNSASVPANFEAMFAVEQAAYATPFTTDEERRLDDSLEQTRALVGRLAQRGARVILFEPPIDRRLAEATRSIVVRQRLHRMFPDERYAWLSPAQGGNYLTGDGLHLIDESAQRFARVLEAAAAGQTVTKGK